MTSRASEKIKTQREIVRLKFVRPKTFKEANLRLADLKKTLGKIDSQLSSELFRNRFPDAVSYARWRRSAYKAKAFCGIEMAFIKGVLKQFKKNNSRQKGALPIIAPHS
ncbi:MAG: hypothetical protein V4449_01100 [Patescibacteria group bacterium]